MTAAHDLAFVAVTFVTFLAVQGTCDIVALGLPRPERHAVLITLQVKELVASMASIMNKTNKVKPLVHMSVLLCLRCVRTRSVDNLASTAFS